MDNEATRAIEEEQTARKMERERIAGEQRKKEEGLTLANMKKVTPLHEGRPASPGAPWKAGSDGWESVPPSDTPSSPRLKLLEQVPEEDGRGHPNEVEMREERMKAAYEKEEAEREREAAKPDRHHEPLSPERYIKLRLKGEGKVPHGIRFYQSRLARYYRIRSIFQVRLLSVCLVALFVVLWFFLSAVAYLLISFSLDSHGLSKRSLRWVGILRARLLLCDHCSCDRVGHCFPGIPFYRQEAR